jgi:hypothetical protein
VIVDGLGTEVLLQALLDRGRHRDDRSLAGDRDLAREDEDRRALRPTGMHLAVGAPDRRREPVAEDDALAEEEAALERIKALDEHLSHERRAEQAQRKWKRDLVLARW